MIPPKRIIVISIDTLRADHLGCYGYKRNTSPSIDELCKESIWFKYAFSSTSFTLPAHASIFTSKYPHTHSIGFNQITGKLDTDVDITLAEVLSSRGYKSAAFISSIVLGSHTNISAGFGLYDDDLDQEYDKTRSDFETIQRSLDWLKQNRDKSIFLFLHLFDVHSQYLCSKPYDSIFVNDDYYGPECTLDLVPDDKFFGGIPYSIALKSIHSIENMLKNVKSDVPCFDLMTGWHELEKWNGIPTRWISGKAASIIIYSSKNCMYDLNFRTTSFYSPRTLEIYANDNLVEKKLIGPDDLIEIHTPIQLKEGANDILLIVPEGSQRPCDFPELNNLDTRELSIAFQSEFMIQKSYESDARYYIAQYDGCIRYVDSLIGDFLTQLKQLNIFDETLLIITSDHGEAMGENNIYFIHGHSVTLDQVAVPLIIKPHKNWNISAKKISTHVSIIDIMPTILSICSFNSDDLDLEGISLQKLIELGHDATLSERILISEIAQQYALIKPNNLMEIEAKTSLTSNYDPYPLELASSINGRKFYWDSGKEYSIIEFDSYQSNKVVSKAINKFRLGKRNFKILEICQNTKRILKRFLTDDEIHFQSIESPLAYRENGKFIFDKDFNINEIYDFIVCVNVFEHVPEIYRKKILDKMVASSSIAAIIATPFDAPNIKMLEHFANEVYKLNHGYDNRNLREHIKNGLPSLSSTLEVIKSYGYAFAVIPNGYLPRWFDMISVHLLTEGCSELSELMAQLNEFYNLNFYEYDNFDPAYRRVIVIDKLGIIKDFTDLYAKHNSECELKSNTELLNSMISKIKETYDALAFNSFNSCK